MTRVWLILVGLLLVLGGSLACSKKVQELPKDPEAAADTPLAKEVFDAISKKDYDTAVGTLLKAKEAAAGSEEASSEVFRVMARAKLKLSGLEGDEAAQKAVGALRAASMTR